MDPTVFRIALWAALALCVAGLARRGLAWSRRRIGAAPGPAPGTAPAPRPGAGAGGTRGRRLARALWGFLRDGLLQRRLLAADPRAWLAHLLVVVGFTLLLVFHALHAVVTEALWPDAAATANPWLFLRELSGALVVVGAVGLSVRRRRRRPRPAGRRSDPILLGLLAVVFLSGFALEAAKILSEPVFSEMTEEWAGEDPADVPELRAFWAAEFGVAFPGDPHPPDPALVEEGRSLHDDACASCHAAPEWAFVAWPLSRIARPAAAPLAQHRVDRALLWVHVLASFAGLAWLPWGRLFHAVADPLAVALAAAARAPAAASAPAGRAPAAGAGPSLRLRRALALDACTDCGLCDVRCSVGALAAALGNEAVLPSAKLRALRRPAGAGGPLQALRRAEGAALCTECHRCTDVCPAALDLADLWGAARADLAAAGYPAPALFVKATPAATWADRLAVAGGGNGKWSGRSNGGRSNADLAAAPLSSRSETFMPCVQCQTCTNVCPVVAHGGAGPEAVDLTPQKVMNLLRLGLRDLALGARMTWDCATCYQCQESCPEGIPVTDVLYELRNLGWQRLRALPADGVAPVATGGAPPGARGAAGPHAGGEGAGPGTGGAA